MFRVADPNSVVFVVLSTGGKARTLSLPPHDERVLVVGSTAQAEFRVKGVGVAPIQFHFERYEDAVWLIPAYGSAALRLNAARVFGPTPLEQRNEIDFCNVRIDATIVDADCFETNSDSLATGEVNTREFRASYSLELPGDQDATQLAVPVADELDDCPTTVFEPVRQHAGGTALLLQNTERLAPHHPSGTGAKVSSSSPDQTTQRIVPFQTASLQRDDDLPALTLNGTQIMAPYRPGTGNSPSVAPPREQTRPPSADSVRVIPLSNAPRQTVPPRQPPLKSHEARMADARQLGSPLAQAAIVALGPAPPLAQHTVTNRTTHRTDASATETPLDGIRSRIFSRPKGVSRLTRLGLMTKTRPLVVASGAIVGAVLLATLLLTATRLAERHYLTAADHSPRMLTPALDSSRPAPRVSSMVASPLFTAEKTRTASPTGSASSPQSSSAKQTSVGPSPRKALY